MSSASTGANRPEVSEHESWKFHVDSEVGSYPNTTRPAFPPENNSQPFDTAGRIFSNYTLRGVPSSRCDVARRSKSPQPQGSLTQALSDNQASSTLKTISSLSLDVVPCRIIAQTIQYLTPEECSKMRMCSFQVWLGVDEPQESRIKRSNAYGALSTNSTAATQNEDESKLGSRLGTFPSDDNDKDADIERATLASRLGSSSADNDNAEAAPQAQESTAHASSASSISSTSSNSSRTSSASSASPSLSASDDASSSASCDSHSDNDSEEMTSNQCTSRSAKAGSSEDKTSEFPPIAEVFPISRTWPIFNIEEIKDSMEVEISQVETHTEHVDLKVDSNSETDAKSLRKECELSEAEKNDHNEQMENSEPDAKSLRKGCDLSKAEPNDLNKQLETDEHSGVNVLARAQIEAKDKFDCYMPGVCQQDRSNRTAVIASSETLMEEEACKGCLVDMEKQLQTWLKETRQALVEVQDAGKACLTNVQEQEATSNYTHALLEVLDACKVTLSDVQQQVTALEATKTEEQAVLEEVDASKVCSTDMQRQVQTQLEATGTQQELEFQGRRDSADVTRAQSVPLQTQALMTRPSVLIQTQAVGRMQSAPGQARGGSQTNDANTWSSRQEVAHTQSPNKYTPTNILQHMLGAPPTVIYAPKNAWCTSCAQVVTEQRDTGLTRPFSPSLRNTEWKSSSLTLPVKPTPQMTQRASLKLLAKPSPQSIRWTSPTRPVEPTLRNVGCSRCAKVVKEQSDSSVTRPVTPIPQNIKWTSPTQPVMPIPQNIGCGSSVVTELSDPSITPPTPPSIVRSSCTKVVRGQSQSDPILTRALSPTPQDTSGSSCAKVAMERTWGSLEVPVSGSLEVPVSGSLELPVRRWGSLELPVSGSLELPVSGSLELPVSPDPQDTRWRSCSVTLPVARSPQNIRWTSTTKPMTPTPRNIVYGSCTKVVTKQSDQANRHRSVSPTPQNWKAASPSQPVMPPARNIGCGSCAKVVTEQSNPSLTQPLTPFNKVLGSGVAAPVW